MKNLNACRFLPTSSSVDETPMPTDGVLDEVIGLRRFLFGRALLLTQDLAAADDLVQNTLERAIVAQVSFQPGTNLKAWLSVILRRRFIDDSRHARVHQRITRELMLEGDPDHEAVPEEPDPRDVLLIDDVVACLGRLSTRDREIFELFHLRHLSYRQIAAHLGVPCATVGTRVHRARRRLRALLTSAFAVKRADLAASAP